MKFLIVLSLILALYSCQSQSECEETQGYYWLQGWGCQPCFANCLDCDGPHTCNQCNGPNRVIQTCSCLPGFIEIDGICADPNGIFPPEDSIDEGPSDCEDDEFWDETSQVCHQCFPNCGDCDDYSTCNECEGDNRVTETCSCLPGYKSDTEGGDCYPITQQLSQTVEDCLSNQYYSLQYQRCENCFANCAECNSHDTCQKCQGDNRVIETCSCKPGFFEIGNEDNDCVELAEVVRCGPGGFWNGEECSECPENCAYCLDSTTCLSCLGRRRSLEDCTVCVTGWKENDDGICVLERPKPKPLPENSFECPDGFYKKNNKCKACYRGCTKCTRKYQCQECVDPYFRDGPSCFCKFGYTDLVGTCVQSN